MTTLTSIIEKLILNAEYTDAVDAVQTMEMVLIQLANALMSEHQVSANSDAVIQKSKALKAFFELTGTNGATRVE